MTFPKWNTSSFAPRCNSHSLPLSIKGLKLKFNHPHRNLKNAIKSFREMSTGWDAGFETSKEQFGPNWRGQAFGLLLGITLGGARMIQYRRTDRSIAIPGLLFCV